MKKLLFATGNTHKLREVHDLLHLNDLELGSMQDIPNAPDPIENGNTFEANALIKAIALSKHANTWTLADDSGIEVDALDKAPGIHSARYAGTHGDDSANNLKLMNAMQGQKNRRARFICALALCSPTGETRVIRATVEGHIIQEQRGSHGFGYDPLFIPDGYTKTFAELGDRIKHQFSHRARAIAQIRPIIETLLKPRQLT